MREAAPLDPRSRRSRAALQGALLEVLTTAPAPEITVATLTARAGVNRSTFYQHYGDVGQLLTDAVLARATEAGADLSTLPRPTCTATVPGALRVLFRHAGDHRSLYRAALTDPGSGALLQQLLAHFTGAHDSGPEDVGAGDHAAAGTLLGCLLAWVATAPDPAAGTSADGVADWAWAAARLAASADRPLLASP